MEPDVDDSRAFVVEGGRHPVVERALRRTGRPFVANDCADGRRHSRRDLASDRPEHGRKSTFLRQNALIALLAQSGIVRARDAPPLSASSARSSTGSAPPTIWRADVLEAFMVEMVETAAILNQADDRALVILDEIGRGTATYDGLSIAWATLEHLHDVNRCRALLPPLP
ncbi:MAG: hypothetical protein R3D56_13155 [Paracoccaceae bacterium]